MAPRKQNAVSRWAISIAVIAGLIFVTLIAAFLLLRHETPSDPAIASAQSDAERIIALCAGGYSDQVTSEVEAGLSEYMTHVRAKTQVGHNTLGAIMKKITSGHSGEIFFKQYQECVKSQTIMHLWPNGHVPPEYLPTIQAAYSEEDRRADVATVEQGLLDHGVYRTHDREPVDGSSNATITPDEITIANVEVSPGLGPDGAFTPPKQLLYHANLHDLTPATIVQHWDGQLVLNVKCTSGDCIDVTSGIATGDGNFSSSVPPYHWNGMNIRLNYDDADQGRAALLQFRRSFARLISPAHSDKEVCEAVAHDPSAPQCS